MNPLSTFFKKLKRPLRSSSRETSLLTNFNRRAIDEQDRLVNALLECPAINNDDTRKEIANTLESKFGCQIKYSSVKKVLVKTIVIHCLDQPDGLRTLLQEIREYDGKESGTAKNVEQLCRSLIFIQKGEQKRQRGLTQLNIDATKIAKPERQSSAKYHNLKLPQAQSHIEEDNISIINRDKQEAIRRSVNQSAPLDTDKDVEEGKKLHWDRDKVVRHFVDMVKERPDSNGRTYRVLVIQGPKEAGFQSLIERFIEICDKRLSLPHLLQNRGINLLLYAKVDLHSRDKVNELARKFFRELRRAVRKAKKESSQQTDILSHIDDTLKRNLQNLEKLKNQLLESQVAEMITECLKEITKISIVVFFIDGFEQVCEEDSGKWLKENWLIDEVVGISKLFVVVTGTSGLETLSEKRDEYIFYEYIPLMTTAEFWQWAQEGYELKQITYEMVKEVNEREDVNGKPEKFKPFLIAWKMLEEKM